ncbi:ABC-type polysaccharide/polyol phosphate export systems permease component-like protein [Vibrio coralliirubri]|uniref:ABC transporter permease n=1 Tax=Vibrio coralliirubri TaxID=1516159 RepID=UPI00062FC14E|nr:ABC transporter permease [Vibrio coralliirubri]CDT77887.1 ABC-type polysaccharide/polyol phosphate export systems permease component-like protein [Vibrio coralliirubri]
MLIQYLQLVDMQAKMKMKAQANKLVLSYLWWVLEPLLFVSMFYLIFELVLNKGGEDFLAFLMVGKIIYMWFSKSVVSASNSIISNKGIIAQKSLPKWIFPMVNIVESSYKSLISFLLLTIVLMVNGYFPHFGYWQLLPLITITFYLICSVGFFCSILVVIAKDFSNLISLGMMGIMFCSGIFWDIHKVSDVQLANLLLMYNPMAAIIDGFRQVLMFDKELNFSLFFPSFVISSAFMIINILVFSKFNNYISRKVFS